jgi:hypothetical protein
VLTVTWTMKSSAMNRESTKKLISVGSSFSHKTMNLNIV